MKNYAVFILTLAGMIGNMATAARADNPNIEEALKSRPNLSSFYKALVDSGVNHELDGNTSYTLFAPTNEAMARIRPEQYPCLYRPDCQPAAAAIIRNHIIPGTVYVQDIAGHKGGFFSKGRFIAVGELYRNDPAVEGHNLLHRYSFNGGVLYTIDRVIANPRELEALQFALPEQTMTASKKTIADPACGPAGCPDQATQTTTITHTILTPETQAPVR